MHQNFPTKPSQFLTGRQRYLESDVVVMKDDAFPIYCYYIILFLYIIDSSYFSKPKDLNVKLPINVATSINIMLNIINIMCPVDFFYNYIIIILYNYMINI